MYKLIKEVSSEHTLTLSPLSYNSNSLHPFISKNTIEAHYGVHTKGYFDNQHKGDFFKAGAFLHEIYWKQFTPYLVLPSTKMNNFITTYFTSVDDFKEVFNEKCMSVQGSGWVYLSVDGKINIIDNHEIKSDILLLQDCWEHAYYLDYGPNKQEYFDNFWKVLNWKYIEERLI